AGRTRPAVAALGLAAGMIPITAYNLRHFGTLGGLHVSANLAALGAGWVASRLTFARTWLGPADSGVAQAALLLLCFGLLRVEGRAARWSAYAGVTLLSVAALTRALPRQSLWGTAPFLATAFLPDGQAAPRTRGLLLLMAAGIVIGVLATAPNDGGAQWGPRYLLLAAMPLALLAADGTRAAWTRRGIDGWAGRLAVVAAFGAAVATTRAGYRDLRSSKRDYAQLAFAIQDALYREGQLRVVALRRSQVPIPGACRRNGGAKRRDHGESAGPSVDAPSRPRRARPIGRQERERHRREQQVARSPLRATVVGRSGQHADDDSGRHQQEQAARAGRGLPIGEKSRCEERRRPPQALTRERTGEGRDRQERHACVRRPSSRAALDAQEPETQQEQRRLGHTAVGRAQPRSGERQPGGDPSGTERGQIRGDVKATEGSKVPQVVRGDRDHAGREAQSRDGRGGPAGGRSCYGERRR